MAGGPIKKIKLFKSIECFGGWGGMFRDTVGRYGLSKRYWNRDPNKERE